MVKGKIDKLVYKYETDYPDVYDGTPDPNRLVGIIDHADVEGLMKQGFNQNGITISRSTTEAHTTPTTALAA